ncbi:hypothetical protein BC834DRAFT_205426 [Gloeopeniophorella convolvens]|nr:hypothetical protein BC834DRAFT_205426 [Gloeopeniophorella convolvens]
MGMSPSPKSSPRGARSSPSSSEHRTLTPQRKHRKMLKDGTSEVWPESVEKIFVDGLRQYWESPWATYSRGRSRWRNQFLVDYLKEAGIERSKKQVASHIQVLRNMWKGEKEYQLVAGGEELFQESGLLSHKSGPPRIAPPDVRVKEECRDAQSPLAPRTPSDGGEFSFESDYAPLDSLQTLELPPGQRAQSTFLAPLPLMPPSQSRGSVKGEGQVDFPPSVPPHLPYLGSGVSPPHFLRNSITALSLCAAGMQPLVVEVDRFTSSSQSVSNYSSRVSIHIRLSLSSLHDVSSPPTLHGFSGTATFGTPWTSAAQCVTRVYAGGLCTSEEQGYFEAAAPLSSLSPTPVTAPLPESGLSSCRWGNVGVETRIIQQVIVDNEELAWITYDLARTPSGPPTAEVVSVHKDPRREQQLVAAPTALPQTAPFLNLENWNSGPAYSSYSPYVPRSHEQPSSALFSTYSSLGGSSDTPLSDAGDHPYTQYSSSALFS